MSDLSKRIAGLSPEKINRLVRQLSEKHQAPADIAIEALKRDTNTFRQSFAQKRLWLIAQIDPESTAYNIPLPLRLAGRLNLAALERSLNEIVRRHEALRTTFSALEGQPVQTIAASCPMTLPVVDLQTFPVEQREAEARRTIADAAYELFDLEQGPLFRAGLWQLATEEHVLLLTFHHIIFDAWSAGVFIGELAKLYAAFSDDRPSSLPELSTQYADYSHWQHQWLQADVLENQLSYWRHQLGPPSPALDLPTDRPRPLVQTSHGTKHNIAFPKLLSEAVKDFSRREGVTLFMTLFAALQTLLYRHTAHKDISIGTSTANRKRAEFEGLIGFFVNTLVLRVDMSGDPTFQELLQRAREVALSAYAHQDVPFEKLVEELQPERILSHSPLFQVAFTLQNVPADRIELAGMKVSSFEIVSRTAKYDMTLSLEDAENGIRGRLEYNTDLFDAATIARLVGHYERLLSQAVTNPYCRISQLSLLGEQERQQLLVDWNHTSAVYPLGQCMSQLFEGQVERTPQALAIVCGEVQVNYAELNERANRMAHYLRRRGVRAEVLVGVLMQRSVEMVVVLLGILKAGGAYLPLDPAYPGERLRLMVEDAGLGLLLTQREVRRHVPTAMGVGVVNVEDLSSELSCESTENPPAMSEPDNLAYLIYTSGSTGVPKGVMIEQRGLVNLCNWHQREFNVGPTDRATQLAGSAFDASVWELWPYLISGASIHIVNDEVRANSSKLLRWLAHQRITICFMPTPMAEACLEEEFPNDLALTTLLIGGDRFHRGPQKALPFEIINNYGPTENTVVTTSARLIKQPGSLVSPPIGRPISNTLVYVLDERLEPVPVGVTGQLYIAGVGLARGYLRSPKLTAERFIPNPFSSEGGERFYATGDMVRYLADGQLEFVGRVDQQVKIRGFRIELGEVEAALCTHAGVRQAVVVAQVDGRGERRLVAYVIEAGEVSGSELRLHLKERLPDYMLPAMFVTVTEMPLTANGKVDRERLPAPEGLAEDESGEYVAPQTAIEEVLAGIWAEVLGVERVSRRDNFFDIGGHSLLMVQVHRKLRASLQEREVAMMDLFAYPTVESLARFLAGGDDSQTASKSEFQPTESGFLNVKQARRDIAIIGMAGRFPGASNIGEFWDNLRNGVESISALSDEELRGSGADEALLSNPHYIKAGSFLENIEQFDAGFFGFNPREAEITDPQHRLFLECAWEVLESAGYDPQQFAGRIGIFAGAAMNSYLLNLYSNPEIMQAVGSFQAKLGNAQDFLASRVAYKLGLRGPSVVVQSACSTSLVAVHLACQSLLNGESDMALAGGISLLALRKAGYMYQEGGIASPDGHCRPFDALAAGTVGGSGVGLVLLKRLADAEAEHDQIQAVIKGSAINNDGGLKVGYTAPSVAGQAEVIAEALAVAGVGAESISYVEAHGTATPLGDPVEVAALTQAFRKQSSGRGYCALGSVKSNIGHLDAAAGVTGLIKTVLALRHEEIPASLHYVAANPAIEFATSPFYVNAELRPWAREAGVPRRAGVSSFGIGGTNAHVVLEEAPEVKASGETAEQRTSPIVGTEEDFAGDGSIARSRDSRERQWHLLMLSARSETTLDFATERLVAHLRADAAGQELADVAFTLQRGRRHFEHRRIVVCRDTQDAIKTLEQPHPTRVLQSVTESQKRPIAFMFSGLGEHYINMGLGLYKEEPVFRAAIDLCAEVLLEQLGLDIRDVIYPAEHQSAEYAGGDSDGHTGLDLREMIKRDRVPSNEATRRLNQTFLTQPAVFVIEYALAKLWMSCGIQPNAMIGYSLGEYVAACLAEVLSLDDALALVAKRAQMIHELPPGGMLAVPLSENEIRPFLGSELSLAAVNGPSLCVVAGLPNAITEVEQKLAEREVTCSRLQTSHAFHSGMMDPIAESLVSILKSIKLNPPRIPYVSNVTGTWITARQATDPYYWAQHLCQAVRFADGLRELASKQDYMLLEIGAGQTLCSLAIQHASSGPTAERVVLPTLRHAYDRQPDRAFFLSSVGVLWLAGVTIDWAGFYANEHRRRVCLPTYPFDRQPYWIERRTTAGTLGVRQASTRKNPNRADWYYLPTWKRSSSLLAAVRDAEGSEDQVRQWLIFADDDGIGTQIAGELKARRQKVVIVQAGKEFERIKDDNYVLNPHQRGGYEMLLKQLSATGQTPESIVHLWSLTQDAIARTDCDSFDEAQYFGYYSLLYLTQALGAVHAGAELHLIVVSQNLHDVTGKENLQPEKATILGLCKVIPQEYSNITCLGIDFSLSPSLRALGPRLIQRFTTELFATPSNGLVAYRGDHRWEQRFEAISLDAANSEPSILREGGVYLIVGGLGKIGLMLADYLARNFGARLVLTGREGLPDPAGWNDWLDAHEEDDEVRTRIVQVRELEKAGAEVVVCRADASSEEQMEAVVTSIHQHFGGLNGVIYAAGIVGEKTFRSIPDTGPTESEWHFRSKAHGLYVLEKVVREERLDFCLLFSSLSSVLGGLGFGAYASANIFMDVFAQRHNRTADVPWISCDWDTWHTAAGKECNTSAPSSLSALFMTPEEGVDAFLRILSRKATQFVVSLSDLHARIDQWLTSKSVPEGLDQTANLVTFHPRPALRNLYVGPRNNTEETLVAIWQEVLGLGQVGIYDDFFQLGGHSLLGTQVISRVRKAFAVDLPVRVIFEAHTVADLAEAIVCRRAEEMDTETLGQLLAELKLLPEEVEGSPETSTAEVLVS